MKNFIFTFIILSFACCAAAAEIKPPADSPLLQNASFAFYAKYVDGEEIINLNKNLRLSPASNAKLFTTAAALALLGPDRTFKTRLYADGKVNFLGTLNGNIYILGGGDPALGSPRIPGNPDARATLEAWSRAVKDAGIKKIGGAVYADSSLFSGLNLPRKFTWEDMGNYYGATADALSFNDNSFKIFFKPQPEAGAAVEFDRTEPEVPGVKIISRVAASDGAPDGVYAFAAPGQFDVEVYGVLAPSDKEDSISASLPNPPLFAAQSLVKELGFKVTGGAKTTDKPVDYSDKVLLYEQDSRPVSEIVNNINKRSFNLYAEVLLRHLSPSGDTEGGVKAVKNFLTENGIDAKDFIIYDGSGLSRYNYVNAAAVVHFLEMMTKQNVFDYFYNSLILPSAEEEDRYFARVFKNTAAFENVRVKTGSLSGVRALSGYAKDRDGRLIAFSFIANNFTAKSSDVANLFNKLVIQLCNLKETPGIPPPAPPRTPPPASKKFK